MKSKILCLLLVLCLLIPAAIACTKDEEPEKNANSEEVTSDVTTAAPESEAETDSNGNKKPSFGSNSGGSGFGGGGNDGGGNDGGSGDGTPEEAPNLGGLGGSTGNEGDHTKNY